MTPGTYKKMGVLTAICVENYKCLIKNIKFKL